MDGAWPTFQYDSANTGYNPNASVPRDGVSVGWRRSTCITTNSSPTVANGHVFVKSKALDASTGEHEWGEFPGVSRHAPTIANGTAFVCGDAVRALDPSDGSEQWAVTIDTGARPLDWSPTVSDGTIYVDEGGALLALDTDGGSKRWREPVDGGVSRWIAVDDEAVYARSGAAVHCFERHDGTRRWTRPTGDEELRAAPAVADTMVYTAGNGGRVYAFDIRTGEKQWDSMIRGEIRHSLAVTERSVVVPVRPNGVEALDRTNGDSRWQHFPDADREFSTPAVGNSAVVVGERRGQLVVALDLDSGEKLWEFDMEARSIGDQYRRGIVGTPALVGGGMYVSTQSGFVYYLTKR